MAELHTKTRLWKISHARQEVYYLAASETNYSWPWLADKFGTDHSTAMKGAKAHERRMGLPPTLKKKPFKEAEIMHPLTQEMHVERKKPRKRRHMAEKKKPPITLHTPDPSRVYVRRVHSNYIEPPAIEAGA